MKQQYSLKITVCVLALLMVFTGWSFINPGLRNGLWRAVLTRPDGREIVFNFESRDSVGRKVLYIMNAGERLLVDSVTISGDSVFFQMPFFDSDFRAHINNDGNLTGKWTKKLADRDVVWPFKAVHNRRERFPASASPRYNITGRWEVAFTSQTQKVTKAVGEFNQQGKRLTGTFLTATGDYRYLEGVVSGDSLVLSTFDGGNAYLFTARISNDSTFSDGNFFTGQTGFQQWTAKKDAQAALPDGYGQTTMRPGESTLNFRFKSIDGDTVSINDERFKDKVVVVQILGSWCPNCMDETRFLSEYYNQNRQKKIEMIGVAYERTTDFERSRHALNTFREKLKVNYPLLVPAVSVTDSFRTEKTIPQLNSISAFPTSIFIDRKGKVRKIYTGFTGPGTGVHYENFKKEFDETIRSLLAEN